MKQRRFHLFLLLLAVGCSMLPLAALEEETPQRDLVWVLALGLCLVHLTTPVLKSTLDRFNLQVTSFGGGAAITYVFLHLLPELSEDNEFVGGHIYGVVLVGFIIIYGVTTLRSGDERRAGRLAFTQAWLYSWLLVYGVEGQHLTDPLFAGLATLALSFHLMHDDYYLSQEHAWIFQGRGRLLLASAPLFGLVSRTYFQLRAESLKSLVTAVLAGMIIYNAFEDGLPSGGNKAAFPWFVAGACIYGTLAVLMA
jgi:hypothetical protein